MQEEQRTYQRILVEDGNNRRSLRNGKGSRKLPSSTIALSHLVVCRRGVAHVLAVAGCSTDTPAGLIRIPTTEEQSGWEVGCGRG